MTNGRVFAISDLHVDEKDNLTWVQELSDENYLNDTIIVAGDITHVLSKLTLVFQLLKSKFKDVYYCSGNHELWVKANPQDQEQRINDSIAKFHHILKLCETMGVRTKPGVTDGGVTIVPLFAWYDESLHMPNPRFVSDLQLWTDYHRCQWTDEVPREKAAEYFVRLNDQYVSALTDKQKHPKIITFSHFLTSKKLMQAYGDEMRRRVSVTRPNSQQEQGNVVWAANFSLVAGTDLLDEQIQRIKPQIHIFGHSHRKMVLEIGDGVRYTNNPLGYTAERAKGLIEPPFELQELHLESEGVSDTHET